ncbi:MAG: NfeD family protein [Candidatus Thioglobus sp.]|jgi:membrane protein implicated in regulation of membrane protease activity|nr:NfeD family protein [Candidatus Thioglobus sp.]|tara:strand:- start:748 stop:1191 length:444 start_codon:yes stop_codon:yes gene_type:complete
MEVLFESFSYLHWLILGLLLVITELFLWSIFLLWFGVSAVTMSIVVYLYPQLSLGIQLVTFVLLSAATSYVATRYFPVRTVDDEISRKAKDHIDKECTVVSTDNNVNKVKLGESLWFAKGFDMSVGQKVRITGTDDSTLIVEPIPEN